MRRPSFKSAASTTIRILRAGDRETYGILLALVLLAAAAVTPWLAIPSTRLSYVGPGRTLVVRCAPSPYASLMRAVTILYAAAVAWGFLRRRSDARLFGRMRRAGGWFLILLLLFPCWVRMWEPERLSDMHLLYEGMSRVVEDMELSLPLQERDWRRWQDIRIVSLDSPPRVSPYDGQWLLPSATPFFFRAAFFDRVWGINNVFLAFVGPGWILAVAGVFLTLLASFSLEADRRAILKESLLFLAALFCVAGIILFPRFMSERAFLLGERAFSMGEPRIAERWWLESVGWWPSKGRSWVLAAKLGTVAEMRGERTSFEARLSRVYTHILNRDYPAAVRDIEEIRRSATQEEEDFLRLWAGTARTAWGNEIFNAGDFSGAAAEWRAALADLPTYPLPWYGLALYYLKMGQYEEAERCYRQLVLLQRFYPFEEKLTVRSQAFLSSAWRAYRSGDWPAALRWYALSLQPDRWD